MGVKGSLQQWLAAFWKDAQGRRRMSEIRLEIVALRRQKGRANLIFYLLFKPDSESWGALVKLENNIRWCHRLPGYGAVITQVSGNKTENLLGSKISKDTALDKAGPVFKNVLD